MNDERSMILKMLQDGKISLEEANALLDVLNEEPEEDAGGFAKTEEGAQADADSSAAGPRPGGASSTSSASAGGASSSREGGSTGTGAGPRGVHVDVDLSGLKESLRMTMGSVRETIRGVSDTLRDAFSDLGDVDIVQEFGRAMGRVRAADERELHAQAGSSGTLRIAHKWGDVRVTGVDATAISGTARVTCWAADQEAADAALGATSLELVNENGEWVLEGHPGSERGTRIDVELTVPRGFDVSVSTASGDLWLEDLAGSQTVNTMSGDINVASLGSGSGDVHTVSTKSGDVIAAALAGDITLNSLSGDISVNGFRGVLRITSKSGDIRVSDGRGSAQLRAMSGDVHVRLLELGDEPLRLTSVSGDVRLIVPKDASLELEARSTSGEVGVQLPLQDESRSEHKVSGLADGGALRAELSSVSGDVDVRAGEE